MRRVEDAVAALLVRDEPLNARASEGLRCLLREEHRISLLPNGNRIRILSNVTTADSGVMREEVGRTAELRYVRAGYYAGPSVIGAKAVA